MHIFDIPSEIRLKIYSELLVLLEPIVFVAGYGPPSPPLLRSKGDGLCPVLLHINKRMYSEANTLLYSNNRFRFPEIFTSHTVCHGQRPHRPIPSSNRIPSKPYSPYPQPDSARHHKAHIKNLDLIRDTCTSIRTLELLVSPGYPKYPLSDSPIAAEALYLLDTHFRNVASLKEVVINFEVYPERDPSDDLTKRMHDYGWTIKVTELPKKNMDLSR